jgi:hypothetical protein
MYVELSEEDKELSSKKRMEENKRLEDILGKLEQYQREEEDLDEEKVEIFKYYKKAADEPEEPEDLD